MTQSAFVNQFWGPGDGGFAVVQQRLRSAESTLSELLHFYKERIAIEKEYTKRLDRLNSVTLGGNETGSLKIALEKLLRENVRLANDSKVFVSSVAQHNYDKLAAFAAEYKRGSSKIENHMQKVLGCKRDLWALLDSARAKYRAECLQVKLLMLLCQTTWGRELEKNEARLRRAQRSLEPLRLRYQEAVALYRAVHETWVRDWAGALGTLYLLEIERIQMCKLNCFSFCNHVALLCVAWDLAADSARLTIADVVAPRDIAAFAHTYGTGSAIDGVPEFVDYLEGKDDVAVEPTTAHFDDPDYSAVLLRTFSVQSGLVPGEKHAGTPDAHSRNRGHDRDTLDPHNAPLLPLPVPLSARNKALPPVHTGTGPTPVLEVPQLNTSPRKLPSYSTFNSDDMFDKRDGSDYSSPTNYTVRSWASPRKNTPAAVQDNINRRLRDMTAMMPPAPAPVPTPAVPITKDFSIDFIAKALEDLDAGGNGDVLHLRRSVRARENIARENHARDHLDDHLADLGPDPAQRPASDFVDDSHEVATRFHLISFKSPHHRHSDTHSEKHTNHGHKHSDAYAEPQSPGKLPHTDLARTVRRSLLKSPTKSYTNLHALVEPQHVTKARAKYSYTAREDGELSFRKGWNMYVLEKQEDNWYVCQLADNCGTLAGEVGLVPYNYVVEGPSVF